MQNLTSRKDKEFVSEKLNQQIRHLLFLNPLLDIRVIKNHLAMLPNQLKNDKLETIRLLTKQRMDFVNCIFLFFILMNMDLTMDISSVTFAIGKERLDRLPLVMLCN